MSFEKSCGRNLNDRERREFLRLVDAKAKIRTFKKNLRLSKKDVVRQLHFLSYHRKYTEVSLEMMTLNRLKLNTTEEEKEQIRKKKVALRNRLRRLWKKLEKEWNTICDQLS